MTAWTDTMAREALGKVFRAAIDAADPRVMLADFLPEKPRGRCVVVGAGKSAAVMAAALEAAWPEVALSGVVVTRYGHAVPTRAIEVIEASHPVPDANSEAGARRVLAAVQGLGPDDLVIALMSGGGSALMALPAAGLTLADKQAVNRALLASGATISQMNAVRKHLSAIKGGRLAAAAAPARLVTLAISDVPGDDPAVIASGPTVPDPTTFADARALVARFGVELAPHVTARLAQAADETPKEGSLPHASFRMIAAPSASLLAAARAAEGLGITPTAAAGTGAVAVGRGDHGHHWRRAGGAGRTQHRVLVGAGAGFGGYGRDLGGCGRYRWDRRHRGCGGRVRCAGYAGAGAGGGAGSVCGAGRA